jgi:hypothetical protein
MTVLKVMFTAIVVAMALIFLFSGLGLLDYNLIWVNPTYLWPGIIGGLVMGVGFIVGGFCPGTSLVAAATFKIDGLFFVSGVLAGIFVFGETVDLYDGFFNSSYMGRFTLMDLFNTSTGWVTLAIVLMALFMFWGAEQLEKIFGGIDPAQAPKLRLAGAGLLLITVLAIIVIGQPTTSEKWTAIAPEKQLLLDAREIQIHPGELLEKLSDKHLRVMMIDVRDQTDFNVFHLLDAENIPLSELPEWVPALLLKEPNTIFVLMSNDETVSTEAWKLLAAESIPNIYVLEGGINNWLAIFTEDAAPVVDSIKGEDILRFRFDVALGSRHPAAHPNFHDYELEYIPKVKLELKRGPTAGGCG